MIYVDPAINGRLTLDDKDNEVPKFEAPKATLMALIIDGIMNGKLPWGFVLLGVSIAVVMYLAGVPVLAFAVGVYLPLSTSMPIFVGGDGSSAGGSRQEDRPKRNPTPALPYYSPAATSPAGRSPEFWWRSSRRPRSCLIGRRWI